MQEIEFIVLKLKNIGISLNHVFASLSFQRYLKLLAYIGIYGNLLNFGDNNLKFYSAKRYPNDYLRLQIIQHGRPMDKRITLKLPLWP